MSKTLMLIDDSRTALLSGRAVIQQACPGWKVLLAKNADEALAQTEEGRAAIEKFLIDVNLPGLPGTDLAARIRALYPDAQMAFITANTQEYVRQKAEELGMGVVGKPLTLDKFNGLLVAEFADDD